MARKIVYWISTAIVSVMLLMSLSYLTGSEQVVSGFAKAGYPQHLRIVLGIAKPLAAVVLLLPGLALVKEWAYAGVAIALIMAFISAYSSGEGVGVWTMPLGILVLAVVSYLTRPASRVLKPRGGILSAGGAVMLHRPQSLLPCLALGLAAAAATPALATAQGDRPAGRSETTNLLSEDLLAIPGKQGHVLHLKLPPGWVGLRHVHTGDVFVYVLSGEFGVDVEGKGRLTFAAGEVYHEAVNTVMQARNLYAGKPTEILLFQVGDKGKPLTVVVDGHSPDHAERPGE